MAEEVKYNSIIVSGRKDETLTYTKFIKDYDSKKSIPTLLDEKVGWADQIKTDNIADGAVTTDKLADSAVTVNKLGKDSVSNFQIIDGSVSTAKILDGAVTTEKIKDASVTTDKIKDEAVTMQKLEDYVQQTIGTSLYDAVCRYEFTDVDEAGQDRHMRINLFQWKNNEGTDDHLSGSVPTADDTYDGLMSATSYRTLASVKSTADKLNDNYLRRNGANSMTGDLSVGSHSILNVNEVRSQSTYGGDFVSFTATGYEIAFGYGDNGGGADTDFEDFYYGGFKPGGGFYVNSYSHAVGFKTTNQTYYGLLANNGETIQAMSDSDVTSVANAVFNS